MADVEVAVPTPLPQTFTYEADGEIAPGARVLVPFGRRKVVGVALGPGVRPDSPGVVVRRVESVVDETPVYSQVMLEMARWMAGYYMHPLGEVLKSMLPAGAERVASETYALTDAGIAARGRGELPEERALAQLFRRKTSLKGAALKKRLKELAALPEADGGQVNLRKLTRAGFVTRAAKESSMRARSAASRGVGEGAAEAAAAEAPRVLTPAQAQVVQEVVAGGLEAARGGGVFLLRGVTGSGKTEVYLHLIAESQRRAGGGGQTLVLVPEISLTPQMTRIFEKRFPGRVAVVHSAMTDTDRWNELLRVRRGEAAVLIGPRSAVFGPFADLRLVIVDEEHDASYKQTTGLTYNGRDVAVLRGRLEGATVLLGSATPSMESWHNARTGRYRLLELPDRVTGRPLPAVEVLPLARRPLRGSRLADAGGGRPADAPGPGTGGAEADPRDELPVDPRVVEELRANHAAGHQAIVLVNRRGYAHYLLSLEDRKPVQCPNCSISMTLHRRSTVLRCHYCDYAISVAQMLAGRPAGDFVAVGYGSQKAEDCLAALLPEARISRLDSDMVTDRELLPRILGRFRDREIDILVGTQILAKGHDFPNVTLIVLLEVDQLLGLPDFRAGERTFQLIVQAAGRAGRAELPGRVLIQTSRADHPVVAAAVRQDFEAFAARELAFRLQHSYPPGTRMIAVEFNGPDRQHLAQLTQRIEGWLDQLAALRPALLSRVRVLGPATPPIETIRGRHRRSVLFTSAEQEPLRLVTRLFVEEFGKPPHDLRMRIDVDPQSLI